MKAIYFIFSFFILSTFLAATIINVPGDQPTIQEGINVAVDSDTVLVQPDTYFENINYNGKNITVASLFLTTQDTTYISQTTIDGDSSGSVVTFTNGEDSTAVLCGFTITNGSVTNGGGIYCYDYSSPRIENIIITGNSAANSGGGILCYAYSSPSLQNVAISSNSASNSGGGIFCFSYSSPSLQNVTISGNSAANSGGGISCWNNSAPSFNNVTISGNSADDGGGIYCTNNSSPVLINSILWNDSPQEIYISSGSVTATYSDIQGGWTGTGNIDDNPLFVDPANGDYHLDDNSPCIDAGDPTSPLDPDDTIADMGAYYFHQYQCNFWHISTTGSDITGTGSEQYPFATIQHGINCSADTDTVLVQPGTYVENINYNGKLITIGSLFLTTQDTTYISSTIIDGNNSDRVVTFENGENSSAVLCGFTITNGFAEHGGGIHCYYSSPSLENVTISGNSASPRGGGIHCYYSSPSLENVTISGNSAINGGGICCDETSPSLKNVTITGNSASNRGGGIYCEGEYSYLSLENVTITGNSASNGGGIYFFWYSCSSLENVTISGNTAGGIHCEWECNPSLINSILWNNLPSEISIVNSSVNATYSDIEGGWVGTGNIDRDPLFVDPGNNKYYLFYNSPCVDVGDPSSPLDPDGTRVDMGAYYFDQSINGNPTITAVTDVPNDQGHFVIVTWQKSLWDQEFSSLPIVGYNLWEKYPYELDRECIITNDINRAIHKQDIYFQREDTTWVLINYVAAMQWEEYSALAETFFDSTTVGDYLSYFFVSAHTISPSLYFSSSVASGYSVDNIAPDETRVYITQNGSNIDLNWDEVEYGTFQGNSYPEINGIWYKIYAGDSPDFVCDEAHLVDTVTNLNYDYPLTGEEKKFFKIVVSDQP